MVRVNLCLNMLKLTYYCKQLAGCFCIPAFDDRNQLIINDMETKVFDCYLTKEQIIELGSTGMIAEALQLDYAETTIGMNGYPKNIKCAIISDSIKELNNLTEYLEKLGFEVEKLELHKKDGWSLYNRTSICRFEAGQYQIVNDQDTFFDFDPEWTEEEAKQKLFEFVVGESPADNFAMFEHWYNSINDLYNEMSRVETETRFFLDANNNYAIEYSVSKDSACYSYDTHNYQLAIMVTFN